MGASESREVVVLGAGVAGLLIASELAPRHDVLVIERADRPLLTKYWLTDRQSADQNPHLANSVDSAYSQMDFAAYDGTRFTARGDYVLWHSETLLSALADRIVRHGGQIDFGQHFYSLESARDGITVLVNNRRIRAQLVVDCMGTASPIIYAKGIVDVLGYYLLYGATFQQKEQLAPVGLHNLMLQRQPAYVEAFPARDDRLHVVLIIPAQQLRPTSDLAADFKFIVSKSPYSKFIDAPASRDRRFLGGIVPVARMRRAAIDRIFFFGEAGQVNPAASATALTRMLRTCQQVASHLSRCLDEGMLAGRDLGALPSPLVGPLNQRVQRTLFRAILRWNSDDFRRVVSELVELNDSVFVNHLVFGDLPENVHAVLKYARKLIRTRSTSLLSALARGAFVPFS